MSNYYEKVYGNFVTMLAERYVAGEANDVAELCDTKLDRSGRLLGVIRERARAISSQHQGAPHDN